MLSAAGTTWCSSSMRFCPNSTFRLVTPVRLPPWSVQAGDQALPHRITANVENDWNACGRTLGRARCGITDCGNYGHPLADQVGRHSWQAVEVTFGPAVLDGDVAALDIARFGEALVKRGNTRRPPRSGNTSQHADHGIAGCCARAASGHAAAAPPSSVMNSRLFTRSPRRRGRARSAALSGRASLRFEH